MSNDVELPPPGYLLFQKILPAQTIEDNKLKFSNQKHIQIIDKICNGNLFGDQKSPLTLNLFDEKGTLYQTTISLLENEPGQKLPVLLFTVGSLVDEENGLGLKCRDRLLFYSMKQKEPQEYDQDMKTKKKKEEYCIRIRIKRGTCCGCYTENKEQGLIACCQPSCDKAFHLECVGLKSVPERWDCPECQNKDQQKKDQDQEKKDHKKNRSDDDKSSSEDQDDPNDSDSDNPNEKERDSDREQSQQERSKQEDVEDAESAGGHPLPPEKFIEQVQQFYLPGYNLQRCFEALGSQMAGREMLNPPSMKECGKCKQVKTRRDFFRSYFTVDGLQGFCRQCKNYQVYDGELGLGQLGVAYMSIGHICMSCKAFQPGECFMDEMCETCLKNGIINQDIGIVDLDEDGLEEKEGETKKCLKCLKVHRLDMFWHNVGAKDGFDSRCKICKTLAKKRNNPSKRKRSLEDIQAERERGRLKRMQKPPHIKDEQDFKQEIQLLSDLNQILVVDVKEAMKSCEKALEVSRLVLKKVLEEDQGNKNNNNNQILDIQTEQNSNQMGDVQTDQNSNQMVDIQTDQNKLQQ